MQSIHVDDLLLHHNTAPQGFWAQMGEGMDSPDLRVSRYVRHGEHGAFVSNHFYGGRLITLTGTMEGSTPTEYQQLRRQLMEKLRYQKSSTGVPILRTMKVTTLDSLAVQASVVLVAPPMLKAEKMTTADFLLQFFSPDYAWYSQQVNTESFAVPSGGGAIYPVIYPVTYAPATGGAKIVTNAGTVESYPVLILNGPLNNPIIRNTTVNRYIELNLTISTGEQLIVDMLKKTAILNGSTPVVANLSSGSKYWWLEPGDNAVSIQTSNGGDAGNVQLQWRNAYLSI